MTDERQQDDDAGFAAMVNFLNEGGKPLLDSVEQKNESEPVLPEGSSPDTDSGVGGSDSLVSEVLSVLDEEAPESSGTTDESSGDDSSSGTDDGSGVDLDSLAGTLGLDKGDVLIQDGALKLRTKVDGEEALVSVSELRKGYQLQSHFTRQNEAFLKQREDWERVRQEQETRLQTQTQLAAEVLSKEEKELDATYTRDWESLRKEDPAEYAAQVADYNRKKDDIQKRQQALVQEFVKRQQETQQQTVAKHKELLKKGREVLSEKLGWKDAESFEKGAGKLREYLVTQGVSEQQVSRVTDPVTLIISDKARQFDELMEKVNLAKKKVQSPDSRHKVPKGAAFPPKANKKRKMEASMARLREEQSVDAAADVFDRMGLL